MAEIESVWEYPRPPRLEGTDQLLRVVHGGVVVAETRRGLRILETSHPPVFYFPPEDVRMELLRRSARRGSFCEFKGVAGYWDLVGGGGKKQILRFAQDDNAQGGEADSLAGMTDQKTDVTSPGNLVREVAWSYREPSRSYAGLKNYLAFYASLVDECWVGEERVVAQAGDFYGGWITSAVRGPFKGEPGTMGW